MSLTVTSPPQSRPGPRHRQKNLYQPSGSPPHSYDKYTLVVYMYSTVMQTIYNVQCIYMYNVYTMYKNVHVHVHMYTVVISSLGGGNGVEYIHIVQVYTWYI